MSQDIVSHSEAIDRERDRIARIVEESEREPDEDELDEMIRQVRRVFGESE